MPSNIIKKIIACSSENVEIREGIFLLFLFQGQQKQSINQNRWLSLGQIIHVNNYKHVGLFIKKRSIGKRLLLANRAKEQDQHVFK